MPHRPNSTAGSRPVRRSTIAAGLCALTITSLSPPPAAEATSAQQAIQLLSDQRAANGLPAGLTEVTAASDGCAKHLDYLLLNKTFGHDEDPALPGYTPEGDRAGNSSNLSYGGASLWSEVKNPWDATTLDSAAFQGASYAPLHFESLVAPDAQRAWYAERDGFACMNAVEADHYWATQWGEAPGEPRTWDKLTFLSYPGSGRTDVPPAVHARELPFVPQEAVGIPADKVTGPNLLVFVRGWVSADPELKAAVLTGPDGPVEVRTADRRTAGPQGSGWESFLRKGGYVIPVDPLKPNASYQLRVTWAHTDSAGEKTVDQTLDFRTRGSAPQRPAGTYQTTWSTNRGGSATGSGDPVSVAPLVAGSSPAPADTVRASARARVRRGVLSIKGKVSGSSSGRVRMTVRYTAGGRKRKIVRTLRVVRGAFRFSIKVGGGARAPRVSARYLG